MILSCNSCKRKFLLTDNAISDNDRLERCSLSRNKWTHFQIGKKEV
jgi:hypothetical protein